MSLRRITAPIASSGFRRVRVGRQRVRLQHSVAESELDTHYHQPSPAKRSRTEHEDDAAPLNAGGDDFVSQGDIDWLDEPGPVLVSSTRALSDVCAAF
jgi:hypothetical protein